MNPIGARRSDGAGYVYITGQGTYDYPVVNPLEPLNVTPNLVSTWELGEKLPSGPALKVLSLVEKHGIAAVGQA